MSVPKPFQDIRVYSHLVPNDTKPRKSLFEENPDYSSRFIFTWRTYNFMIVEHLFDFYQRFFHTPFEERNFFEVIPNGPQKLHFDIDIERNKISIENFNVAYADSVRNLVIENIYRFFVEELHLYENSNIDFQLFNDVLLFTSHREDKFSYHIIVDNLAFPSAQHCQYVTQWVIDRLPGDMINYLDTSVNKTNQQFRLVWNQKEGKSVTSAKKFCLSWNYHGETITFSPRKHDDVRWNSPDPNLLEFLYFERSLVSKFTYRPTLVQFPLPGIVMQPKSNHVDVGEIDRQLLEPLIPEEWEIIKISGNFVSLRPRGHPICLICRRIHEHENQYVIISGHRQIVYFKCWRNTPELYYLGELNPNYQEVKSQPNNSAVAIAINDLNDVSPGLTVNPETNKKSYVIPSDEKYKERFVKPIQPVLHKIYLIESYLGTGKTSSIINYVRENNFGRVLILSPRILYAKAITNEYNSQKSHLHSNIGELFQCYTDKEGQLTTARLVISMESLWRLSPGFIYDVLILDEAEALLSQFNSKTMRNKIGCAKIFECIVKNTPIVIAGDAFVSRKSVNTLKYLKPLYFVRNLFVPDKREAIELPSWEQLIYQARNLLLQHNRIVFVCGSLRKAEEFGAICQLNGIDHRIYSSKHRDNFSDLENVNEHWTKHRCIIYTSSITVGVNFDVLDYFDYLFVFGSTRGCKARDTIQGTLRVRHLTKNKMFFSLYNRPFDSSLPTKLVDIYQMISIKVQTIDNFIGPPAQRSLQAFNGENWPVAPDWLKECYVRNVQEQNASASYYGHVFKGFLERSNYELLIPDLQLPDNFEVGLKPPPNNGVSQIITYFDIPIIQSFQQYQHLVERVKAKMASQGDILTLDRYRFDSNVSRDLIGPFRNELFSRYFKNDRTKAAFYNLRNEKFSFPEGLFNEEIRNIHKEVATNYPIKFRSIEILNSCFDISNSSVPFNRVFTGETLSVFFSEADITMFRRLMQIKSKIPSPSIRNARFITRFYTLWTGVKFKYKRETHYVNSQLIETFIFSSPGAPIWDHLINGRYASDDLTLVAAAAS